MSRTGLVFVLSVAAALVLAVVFAVRGDGARMLFHEVYERISGAEVLGPDAQRDPPVDSPYLRWLDRAGDRVPISTTAVVADVRLAELRSWPEKGEGVSGLYLRLQGEQMMDARLLELPPGGATLPERHLYEKGIYFLGGPGYTVLETRDSPPRRVDWQAGSLLSIPLNTRYRHVNRSDAPVRLLAVSTFPFVLNSFDNETFIYRSDFEFADRYSGSADDFGDGEYTAPDWLTTNFVPDIRDSGIADVAIRGRGNRAMHWDMAGNRMLSLHVSEIPPGRFKKAHRHSNGSAFLLLSGSGYTLSWPARAEHRRQRVDWKAGTFFAPPPYWYHQHFNPGDEPARYLSVNTPDLLRNLGLRFTDQVETAQPELRAAFDQERTDHERR